MTELDQLTDLDQDVVTSPTRDFSRGRLSELAGQILDAQDQLEAMWRNHERRYGPDLHETVRETVNRALPSRAAKKS